MSCLADRMIATLLAVLVALVVSASAFWRLPCKSAIVLQRADPIVSPGIVSGHVHTIMGGDGFGFQMTYADTQKSTCSSCMVIEDSSNYWVPTLYYKAQDGSFINVGQSGGATIYYLQRSHPNDPRYEDGLIAFPKGFRMVAGDPFLRNYTGSIGQQAVSFACLGTQNAETHNLPNYNCPHGLRAQIFFPSCWDGESLDSPDHKSHMSYPSAYNSGYCPLSHPIRFISLFYEVIWNVDEFASRWYGETQPFVFSMGDSTGYGYHGDFVNGWDVDTLQRAIDECTAPDGNIEECAAFSFYSDYINNGCKIPASVHEKITGVLPTLPGCNPVQSGPEVAVPASGCGAPTTIGTPQYNFVDMTKSKGWAYIGCTPDYAGQTRTLNRASLDQEDMTNEKCIDTCESQGYNMAGTEYATQCFCGNSMTSGRSPTPGLLGNCMMPCAGNSSQMCGGSSLISVYKKCTKAEACTNVQFSFNPSITGTSGSGKNIKAGIASSSVVSSTKTATKPKAARGR